MSIDGGLGVVADSIAACVGIGSSISSSRLDSMLLSSFFQQLSQYLVRIDRPITF
jgi:hypothetical protein